MRRIAPFLTLAVIVAGFWWALKDAPPDRRREPRRDAPKADVPADTSGRPAESRPESTTTRAETGPAESRPESQPESAPVESVVVIEVVREDRRPVGYAIVNVIGVASIHTDFDGRAEVPADPGKTAEVTVKGLEFLPVETTVLLDSGTRQIVVPTGATVAGRVTVNGKAPDEPVVFLLTDGDAEGIWLETQHRATTDAEGAFEFFNLAPTWNGRLSMVSSYKIVGHEDGTIALSRPNQELALSLIELPRVKGRLVRHGTREPCGGSIRYAVDAEHDGIVQTSSSQTFVGGDGRFELFFEPNDLRVVCEFADSNFLGTRRVEVQGPFDVVRNLGDIELGAIRQVTFRVRDTESRPVAEAMGAITGTWEHSELTDEEGRSAISTDEHKRELRVGKLGYATTVVPIPEKLTIPLEVELKPGNQLVIDIRLPDDTPPKSGLVALVLDAEVPMFTGPDGMSDDVLTRTGATQLSEEQSSSAGASSIGFAPGDAGRVIAAGFRPGAAFRVELRGKAVDELIVEDYVLMPAEGTKRLTLRAPRMPQTFVGVVRSEDGRLLEGATGHLRVAEGREVASWQTNAEGKFTVGGIFADAVDVEIHKEGFVTLRQAGVQVSGATEHAFTLVATRTVIVVLVDERGRPILMADPNFAIRLDPAQAWLNWDALGLGGGRFELKDIPPGPIDLYVAVGTTMVEIPHDSRNLLARIVVPTVGTVELHWRRDARDPENLRFRIESEGTPIVDLPVPADIGDHQVDAQTPPGIYVATVEAWDEDAGDWVVIATSRAFEIAAHHSTEVELRR